MAVAISNAQRDLLLALRSGVDCSWVPYPGQHERGRFRRLDTQQDVDSATFALKNKGLVDLDFDTALLRLTAMGRIVADDIAANAK